MSIRERAVVLIDGPAVVHRWYHRWFFTNEKAPKGIDPKRYVITQARYMIATAHSFDPSHLAQNLLSPQVEYAHTPKHNKIIICFDNGDGGRRDMYPEYKANREGKKVTPEFLLIEKVAKKVFQEEPKSTILVLPDFDPKLKTLNAEADDMIATIALRNHRVKLPTIVMSHDHDLYQLIDDNARSYHYDIRSKHLVSEKSVMERVGVHPKLIRDFKALAGDASDNISGISGIGKVRARQLLKKYGDLDGILANGVNKESGRVGDLLRNGAQQAESV
ncbi:mitochondrial structure specific endonuclease I (SSE-1) [Strigomonas culicis]|uniref:Mitochondrial structure specific endonuclease I (SSE-1) n=1 Tax=Strigomonas culicis TaxID=28005 RepID=S9WAM2_9TRYP|nr:mitochondrial structure specific endonuclease I (SSE-1) [Strigomonas culicis]|eukprot:EPY36146.1 mitochondrial structure specific endonuclease I (SSE-1) [Strigomonas culicis]